MRVHPDYDPFVRSTFDRLLAFVRRRVRRPEVAEDIVQDGFASVLADDGFDVTRPDAAGYLRRRVNWLLLDHLRQSGRLVGLLGEQQAGGANPQQAMESSETQEAVRQAIGQLPPEQQAVIERWLSGMSHDETAAELGTKKAKVYQLFHKAKRALRWRLAARGRDDVRRW